jgi:hypothetical protein
LVIVAIPGVNSTISLLRADRELLRLRETLEVDFVNKKVGSKVFVPVRRLPDLLEAKSRLDAYRYALRMGTGLRICGLR